MSIIHKIAGRMYAEHVTTVCDEEINRTLKNTCCPKKLIKIARENKKEIQDIIDEFRFRDAWDDVLAIRGWE